MKKIRIMTWANLGFAALFSVLNVCFHADVSCLAFVISLIYSGLEFKYLQFDESNEATRSKKVFCARKFLQYEPYVFLIAFILRRAGAKGTSFAFDFVSVIFWLGVFVTSIILQYWLNPKRIQKIAGFDAKEIKNEDIFKMYAKGKKRDGSKVSGLDYLKWLGFEIIDWGDALIQAVFMVLLFQIFVIQFYEIPSESMVPEYLIKDRVAVTKITSGPKFPLSDVGLPCVKEYHRGDIVVFRNPHYTINRESEVKTVVSQLIYMLTLTFVNTNRDEHGQVKADPLVKRITGVAGEQLMMQDGILYVRTKDSPQFKVVEEEKKWAAYNLNEENEAIKRYIQDLRVSDTIYNEICLIEELRNKLVVDEKLKETFKSYSKQFSKYCKKTTISESELLEFFNSSDMREELFTKFIETYAQRLISVEGGAQWFDKFMTEWFESYDLLLKDGMVGGNLYEDANYKLNLMFKETIANILISVAKANYEQKSAESLQSDLVFQSHIERLRRLHNYMCIMDLRNMPVFPENDSNGNPQYIPEGHYFMMGDNRFNSFDMRHTDKEYLTKITPYDNYSLTYYTSMKPMYVPKKLILGSTGIRFWPIARPVRNKR